MLRTALMLAGCAVSGTLAGRQVKIPLACNARDHGQLPDRRCAPGRTNAAVTQANIASTICQRGWTATVRPPVSYTSPWKRAQIRAYHYRDQNPRHYEEDHLIPLELGGAPWDLRNLWPERGASPNAKDRVENLLNRRVCDRQMPLRQAQREIARNWTLVNSNAS